MKRLAFVSLGVSFVAWFGCAVAHAGEAQEPTAAPAAVAAPGSCPS
jgi:hypothetical protein